MSYNKELKIMSPWERVRQKGHKIRRSKLKLKPEERLRLKRLYHEGLKLEDAVAQLKVRPIPAKRYWKRLHLYHLRRLREITEQATIHTKEVIERNVYLSSKLIENHLVEIVSSKDRTKNLTPSEVESYSKISERELTKLKIARGEPTSVTAHAHFSSKNAPKDLGSIDIFGPPPISLPEPKKAILKDRHPPDILVKVSELEATPTEALLPEGVELVPEPKDE